MISLESALNDAVENAFFPIYPATATMVWLIVRVPKNHFNRGQFEQRTLDHTFRGWIDENIIKILETRMMANMTPTNKPIIRMKI